MNHNRGLIEMTEDMIGKRVIVIGKTTGVILDKEQVDGMICIRLDSGSIVWEHPRNFVLEDDITREITDKEDYDFRHNRGIIKMTDLTSKQVIVDGKEAFVSKDEGDQLYLYFEQGDVGGCNKSRVWLIENTTQQSPKDSLVDLQKLCTTNNIHILISKESSEGSYQIWDECSDDTYEMNNVDDVMKAIECLNELKKWRQ